VVVWLMIIRCRAARRHSGAGRHILLVYAAQATLAMEHAEPNAPEHEQTGCNAQETTVQSVLKWSIHRPPQKKEAQRTVAGRHVIRVCLTLPIAM